MDSDPPSTISVAVGVPAWRTHLTDPRGTCGQAVRATLGRVATRPWLERTEVSILLSDDATVRRLNAAYRGKDRATNVLSFPMFEGILEAAPGHLSPGPVPLGDIVLALETVRTEAAAAEKPLSNHVSHLVVHGCLHLLGFDHDEVEKAARMEGLERTILDQLGIADPYAVAGTRRVTSTADARALEKVL